MDHFDCTPEEVALYLSQMKIHSAPGPDGITAWMLTNFAEDIAPSIASIFNLSIASGRLPADWKLSNIIPIPKCSGRNNVRFSDLFPYYPSLAKFLKSVSIEFSWNSYLLKVSYLMISMDFARAGQLLSHFSWLPMTGISPWRANIKLLAYLLTLTKLLILSHIRPCSTNCTVCKCLLS